MKVKSTVGQRLHALLAKCSTAPQGKVFIGSVHYLSREQILQDIANSIGNDGLHVFQNPVNRAKLVLLKREAFSHEKEGRLLYVCKDTHATEELLPVPLDLNVFDAITFEPRLESFERKEREVRIQNLGYQGHIGASSLYHRTLLQVRLDNKSRNSGGSSQREQGFFNRPNTVRLVSCAHR